MIVPACIHSTVRIRVPDVDHRRGNTRFILTIVLDVTEDPFYKLVTKNGIVKQLYARSQLVFAMRNLYPLKKFFPMKCSCGL